jgi:deoxyribose-phosphate aldolase
MMDYTTRDIAKMIDHSLLRPNLTVDDIVKGCAVARKYGVMAVCCTPADIGLCARELSGTDVQIAAVVGFPHGYATTSVKAFEAREAVGAGANELDMVLHIGRLLSRDFDYVRADITAVVEQAHPHGVLVKVILENCYLTDELKRIGCGLCEEAGADFVKTSTGFGTGGATIEDLVLMRESVSPRVRIKAAGGVRDLDAALRVREAGASRFGATATEAIMEECIRRKGR